MAIDSDKNIRIQTTLNKQLHKDLLEIATKKNTSASKIIKELITEYVNNNKE